MAASSDQDGVISELKRRATDGMKTMLNALDAGLDPKIVYDKAEFTLVRATDANMSTLCIKPRTSRAMQMAAKRSRR